MKRDIWRWNVLCELGSTLAILVPTLVISLFAGVLLRLRQHRTAVEGSPSGSGINRITNDKAGEVKC